jgi:RNA polymerase sigma-70 factor (TIGR02960 family)
MKTKVGRIGMTRDTEATRELIAKAQAGNGSAFAILTDPYRRTLLRHCYRMLGSYQDAEDVLQETLFAAWQGIGRFESRASVRTWLYTIATNRCLNAFRSIRRRPAQTWDIASVIPPEPTRLTEVVWLEPFPDEAALGADGRSTAPDILYERTEDISLAFVTALQLLPPRQLAVLLLRDVVGFHADEVAWNLGNDDRCGKQHAEARARKPFAAPREERRRNPFREV